MTITSPTQQQPGSIAAPRPAAPAPIAATGGRKERRPALIALAILLIAGSGLGVAVVIQNAGNTTAVLALTKTVPRGALIDRDDLRTVNIGTDPALRVVTASELDSVVGQRAATDLPAGTLLPQGAAAKTLVPRRGRTLVGLQLKPSQLPASPLQAGDTVRLVFLPADQAGATQPVRTPPATASVVGSQPGPDNQTTRVDVEVPNDVAVSVSTSAAASRIALVLDSRER